MAMRVLGVHHRGPQAQLRKLYMAVKVHHQDHGKLPASSAPTPPLDTCCGGPEGQCVPVPALWQGEPWASLGFAIDFPQRDSFQILVEGPRVTLRAIGDLDCDGQPHTFEIVADPNAENFAVRDISLPKTVSGERIDRRRVGKSDRAWPADLAPGRGCHPRWIWQAII